MLGLLTAGAALHVRSPLANARKHALTRPSARSFECVDADATLDDSKLASAICCDGRAPGAALQLSARATGRVERAFRLAGTVHLWDRGSRLGYVCIPIPGRDVSRPQEPPCHPSMRR